MRATDAVDLPVDRKSGTAMAKLPPRFAKGASQLSLNTKQKIRARPQEYAYSAAASFQEITRLISLNDEQKLYIQKLHSDMKTLKIVNTRQERALQSLDKDQMEFPKVFQTMSEELRIARSERQKALEKVLQLEKQAVAKAEDFHKLGQRLKDTKDKLKVMMNPDVEALNAELSLKTKELESSRAKIEELSVKLKSMTAERNREAVYSKQKISKLVKELDLAKSESIRLQSLLQERDRAVNALSIYSRHTMDGASDGESSQVSSRTGRSRRTQRKLLQSPPLDVIMDDEVSEAQPAVTPVVNVSLQSPLMASVSNTPAPRDPAPATPLPQPERAAKSQTGASARSTPAPAAEPKKAFVAKHSIFKPSLGTKFPAERVNSPSGYTDDGFHE